MKITADEAYAKGDDAYEAKNYAEAMRWWQKAAEQGVAEAQKREKLAELELSGKNVRVLYVRCWKADADEFDQEAIKENKRTICYLLGQLELVHKELGHKKVYKHPIDNAFFVRYDGTAWFQDGRTMINLLNMGTVAGYGQLSCERGRFFTLGNPRLETECKLLPEAGNGFKLPAVECQGTFERGHGEI